jgi:alpha-1,2-mannosyltransferase
VTSVIVLLCCAGLAWTYRGARLPVLLLLGQGAFLLVTPTWFSHYAGYTAGPIALAIGAAIGRLIVLVRARPARIAVSIAVAAALLVYASGWSDIHFGRRFPDRFKPLAASATGCVTTDDPTALVETDTLSRNLSRGCRFVADLGGHSHDLAAASGNMVSRNKNKPFQRLAVTYLSTGSATILIRFSAGQGFSAKTTAILDQWPRLGHSGKYQVRRPVALGQSATTESPTPQRR